MLVSGSTMKTLISSGYAIIEESLIRLLSDSREGALAYLIYDCITLQVYKSVDEGSYFTCCKRYLYVVVNARAYLHDYVSRDALKRGF